jgi:hypothetical protein
MNVMSSEGCIGAPPWCPPSNILLQTVLLCFTPLHPAPQRWSSCGKSPLKTIGYISLSLSLSLSTLLTPVLIPLRPTSTSMCLSLTHSLVHSRGREGRVLIGPHRSAVYRIPPPLMSRVKGGWGRRLASVWGGSYRRLCLISFPHSKHIILFEGELNIHDRGVCQIYGKRVLGIGPRFLALQLRLTRPGVRKSEIPKHLRSIQHHFIRYMLFAQRASTPLP